MDLAYKFDDEDVRKDETLTQCAYDFLQRYHGDFKVLWQAKSLLAFEGRLPVGQIRTVLNCMRTDTTGIEFLNTYSQQPADEMFKVDFAGRIPVAPLRLVSSQRKAYITMKSTFKAPFYFSQHKQAYRYHRIDPTKSEVIWFPHIGQLDVRVEPYCGVSLRYGVMCYEVPEHYDPCKQCATLWGSRS